MGKLPGEGKLCAEPGKDTWQAEGEEGEEGDVDGKQSDSLWVNGEGMHPGLEGSVKEKHKYSDLGKERGGGLQVGVPRGGQT